MRLKKLDRLNKPYHIYTNSLESGAIDQFVAVMEHDAIIQGALMPDAHQGYSLPIGGVVASQDVIFPSFVGYDIGCGMCALPLREVRKEDVIKHRDKIFDSIYRAVPVGFAHNQEPTEGVDLEHFMMTNVLKEIYYAEGINSGLRQMGSLGGGNHFVEIGYDETDRVWVIIHSGSRGIGHATARHYMKLASGSDKAKEGNYGFDVSSELGENYIIDMNFCLAFALANRKELMKRVAREVYFYCGGYDNMTELINRNHNHAEEKDGLFIHRKGATHAEKGMKGVIPGNMRDGSFIVQGKGNPEALWSSAHGAGRAMGRAEARRNLKLEDFEADMEGITAKVEEGTLEEAPGAYKNIFEIMELQSELVEVLHRIHPIINIKAPKKRRR